MVRFEDLPANVQALMLSKLAMELNIHHCTSLHDLAKKQRTDTAGAWRTICRSIRQPVSTVPNEAVRPRGSGWADLSVDRH